MDLVHSTLIITIFGGNTRVSDVLLSEIDLKRSYHLDKTQNGICILSMSFNTRPLALPKLEVFERNDLQFGFHRSSGGLSSSD